MTLTGNTTYLYSGLSWTRSHLSHLQPSDPSVTFLLHPSIGQAGYEIVSCLMCVTIILEEKYSGLSEPPILESFTC